MRIRPFRVAAAALVAASLAACGGDGENGAAAPPADSGLELDPDRPLQPAGSFTLQERLRISDGRAAIPRDVAVDGEGYVYVLDATTPSRILRYHPSGDFDLQFGTRDTVRERIVSALEMDLAEWGTMLVADRGDSAIKTFLTRGLFASLIPRQESVVLDVHALPEFGEFYLHEWVPSQRRVSVLHMRAPGDSVATTYTVGIPSRLSIRQEARAIHFHSTADRRGRLYVAFMDGYPVRILSPQGTTLGTIGIQREPIQRTAEEMEREAEENMVRLLEQVGDVDEEILREAAMPDSTRPVIEELVVDPQGRLWVRTNRPDAADATPYDMFNSDGDYMARVDVPGDVVRTTFSPAGGLWVLMADGDVVEYQIDAGASAR